MTNSEACETIREMMAQWEQARAKWIETRGSDKGFAEWYTDQTIGD